MSKQKKRQRTILGVRRPLANGVTYRKVPNFIKYILMQNQSAPK